MFSNSAILKGELRAEPLENGWFSLDHLNGDYRGSYVRGMGRLLAMLKVNSKEGTYSVAIAQLQPCPNNCCTEVVQIDRFVQGSPLAVQDNASLRSAAWQMCVSQLIKYTGDTL
jgi:hypothetical protein